MEQLSPEKIKWIGEQCLIRRPDPPITKPYKNVPNGMYDIEKTQTRVFIYNEFAYYIVSKMWVDKNDQVNLPPFLNIPWNSYPDLPAKSA